ncbi:MAG: protein-L-isoaspartate O-methyltransferase, partial [Thermoplasmata archaeon]
MHDNGSNSGTAQYAKFERARKQMVKGLHFRSCVSDKKVIEAMAEIPRHLFVPENVRDNAYDDTPLPIGWNQTISAPHMVGMMAELLELKPGLKVLEIGAGCGYHA